MKQCLLLLASFLLTQVLWAQKITWGVNISPSISYRIPQYPASPLAEGAQIGEKPMHTFDFGIDVRAAITSRGAATRGAASRWAIGSAILYSQKGMSNSYVSAVYGSPSLSPAYLIDFVQDYLEIPFFLSYSLPSKGTLQWYGFAGVTNSLLLREHNRVATRNSFSAEVSPEIEALLKKPYLAASQRHNLGLMGGWGIKAQVDAKTAIGVEALGKLMLTPLQDRVSDSQRHQYSVGLNFRFIRTL